MTHSVMEKMAMDSEDTAKLDGDHKIVGMQL